MLRGPGRAGATTLLLGLLTAACSSDPPEAPAPCPPVVMLQGAESTSIYLPESDEAPRDLQLVVALNDLVSTCRFAGDSVDVALAFNVLAQRGPAAPADPIHIGYFLATVGPERQIVDKQLLDVELSFASDQETTGLRETLTLRLPGVGEAQAAGYRVYVGLQLDEAAPGARRAPLPGGS